MNEESNRWKGSPEERIIRELYRTSEGGLKAGTDSQEYGRVLETLLIRELQLLATEFHDSDVRFSRGYLVEDYGSRQYQGASASKASTVSTSQSPRFDIICYSGDVAWRCHGGLPMALVPASFAHGVIEVKRTLSPGYLPIDSSRAMNAQFKRQKEHIRSFELDIPFILIGAHFSGGADEIRESAIADHVGLLGDLKGAGSAQKMAQSGELCGVMKRMIESPPSSQ